MHTYFLRNIGQYFFKNKRIQFGKGNLNEPKEVLKQFLKYFVQSETILISLSGLCGIKRINALRFKFLDILPASPAPEKIRRSARFFLFFCVFMRQSRIKTQKNKKNLAHRRVFSGAGEAGKISKNLNSNVLTLFMPDKPNELIEIVSIIN